MPTTSKKLLRRTNVFLSVRQLNRLRKVARQQQRSGETHVTVAWLIRCAIDHMLDGPHPQK